MGNCTALERAEHEEDRLQLMQTGGQKGPATNQMLPSASSSSTGTFHSMTSVSTGEARFCGSFYFVQTSSSSRTPLPQQQGDLLAAHNTDTAVMTTNGHVSSDKTAITLHLKGSPWELRLMFAQDHMRSITEDEDIDLPCDAMVYLRGSNIPYLVHETPVLEVVTIGSLALVEELELRFPVTYKKELVVKGSLSFRQHTQAQEEQHDRKFQPQEDKDIIEHADVDDDQESTSVASEISSSSCSSAVTS